MLLKSLPFVVISGLLISPGFAHAEAGELYTGVFSGLESAQLGYVRGGLSGGPTFGTPNEWLLRVGADLRYGFSDEIQIGLSPSLVFPTATEYSDAIIDGRGGSLFAEYSEWSLPVTVSYLLSWGYSSSLLATVELGVSSITFTDQTFVDPDRVDGDGNPGIIPVELREENGLGLYAGARLEWDLRLSSWFVVNAGPYIHLRQAPMDGGSTTNLHWGVAVRPALIWAVGPRVF